MEITWSGCVELFHGLQNDKPGISDEIEKVDRVDFTDFIKSFKSRNPSIQKVEIHAVRTVMEKIQHLERCLIRLSPTVSDHCKILLDVFQNVKVDKLQISGNTIAPNQMMFLARICGTCEVKSLNLKWCNLQSDHLMHFAKNVDNAELENLVVSLNKLTPGMLVQLTEICAICQVKTLRLVRCGLESEHLKLFAENAKDVRLGSLNVSSNELTPGMLVQLTEICALCQVKTLLLGRCGLESEHLKFFAENAKDVTLDNLDVSRNKLTLGMLVQLTEICAICQVKTLDLSDCGLESEHLKFFAKNAKNVTLESLNVSENKLTPSMLVQLTEICAIYQVKTLNMYDCGLGSEHLKLFSENVKNIKIDSLNINENKSVFDFKLGTMAKFRGTKDSVDHLAKICEICQVKKLAVFDCNLQSDQLKKFIKLAKNTKVFYTKIIEMSIDGNPGVSEDAKAELEKFLELNKKKAEAEVDATAAVMDVNVIKSTRDFYEAHLDDVRVYPIHKQRKKGRVLIVNNEFSRTERARRGSLVDLQNQDNLWRGLGFDVVLETNLTADAMRRVCKDFAQGVNNTCVVVVIAMSHGGNRNGKEFLEGEDERFVYTADIISYFNTKNSPHLQGIPKVFFFQACRGGDRDSGVAADATVTKYPLRSDMIITYPSQAGFVSFRDVTEGSWLMNAVTNVFMRYAHDTHIIDMLTMVNDAVARKESRFGEVQMSNQEYYLRKKLFLFPGWPR